MKPEALRKNPGLSTLASLPPLLFTPSPRAVHSARNLKSFAFSFLPASLVTLLQHPYILLFLGLSLKCQYPLGLTFSLFLFSFYAVPLSTFILTHAFNHSPCGKHSEICISSLPSSCDAPRPYQLPPRCLQLTNDMPHKHVKHNVSKSELSPSPAELIPLLFSLPLPRKPAVIRVSLTLPLPLHSNSRKDQPALPPPRYSPKHSHFWAPPLLLPLSVLSTSYHPR